MADAELQSLELQITGDVQKAEKSINSLIGTLDKLKKATAGGCGLGAVTKELSKMKDVNIKFSSSTSNSAKSLSALSTKAAAAVYSLKKVTDVVGDWITESNNYVENLNLFTVSMGEYAGSAKQYAEEVGDVLGIDPSTWMRNQGVFMTLGPGVGVAADRAATMSQQLTQLGYDISSFFNIPVEDAMQRLQSGISGELEPLRRLGYDLSQAKLEATALSLGIDKAVSSMTQAEKAELRYYAIMTQVTTAQGDMARTLEAPANQLRILEAQLSQAARALGNIFIPMLNAVLPYAIAAVKVIRLLANAIANLVGFTMPEVDYSSVSTGASDASSTLEEATESAKKFKKSLLGIDELNVMSDTSSADSAETSAGTGFSFDLPSYDFIGDATNSKINAIVDQMKEWLGITGDISSWSDLMDTRFGSILKTVGLIAAGIAVWKLTNGFITGIATLQKILASPSYSIAVGVMLTVTGFTIAFEGMGDAIKNGLDGFNFGEILGGSLLSAGGAALLGSKLATWISTAFSGSAVDLAITQAGMNLGVGTVGAAGAAILGSVAAVVAGLGAFFVGIYDAIKNGIDWLSGLLIPAGASAAGAGIGAIIGMLGGPIGAGIGALIGLAVGLVTDLVILIVQNWESITSWCSQACADIGQFFSDMCTGIAQFFMDLWSDIVAVWKKVAKWFDTKVIKPVVTFFEGLWISISGFFVNLWNDIVSIFTTVTEWFNTNVIQPVANFFVGLWTGISNAALACWNAIVSFFSPAIEWFSALFGSIFQTISDIFYNIGVIVSGCWEIITIVWGIACEWFDTNVIQPVANFFSELWEGIKNAAIAAWDGIVSVFATIGNWIDTNVIQPVATFFTDLWNVVAEAAKLAWTLTKNLAITAWEGIKNAVDTAWTGIKNTLSAVGNWINNTVIQPVAKFFSNLWDGFKNGAIQAWEGIKSVFSTIGKFFSDVFTKAWQGVVKVFSIGGEIFVKIKDAIVTAFKFVVNGIITGLNSVIAVPFKGINAVLEWLRDINIAGAQPFSSIKTITIPEIPQLATGGVVDAGQMFIAREAGPELVGSVGSKTAVVNNDQIVESVSRGVYNAVLQAMGQSGGTQVVEAKVNDKVLFEVVVDRNRRETMRTGVSPLLGGV